MRGISLRARVAAFTLAAGVLIAGAVRAEDAPTSVSAAAAMLDPNVVPAGCAACGGGGGAPSSPSFSLNGPFPGCACNASGCDGPRCVPGRLECCGEPCEACSMFGRFWCGLKGAFCCPDPCYQPCYIPAADAALFVDGTRPVSRSIVRFDAGVGGSTMDRAEFFFGKFGTKGPALDRLRLTGIGYRELSMINEFAVDRFSVFMTTPYRTVDYEPKGAPDGNGYGSGFGDMMIGTKSLFIDSEMLLFGSEFKTFIPIANFHKGLGTGHVSLEPSLLATIKVMADTYIETQLSEWIPIAGTPGFDGATLHYHASLNHVLVKPTNDLQLIGTMEFVGYWFQDGLFTTTAAGTTSPANRDSYFALGPGVRLVFCTKFDVGFGTNFSVTQNNFAHELYRTEVRWRF